MTKKFWKIYDSLVLHFPFLPLIAAVLFFVLTACGKPENQTPAQTVLKQNPTCPMIVICSDGRAFCAAPMQDVCDN